MERNTFISNCFIQFTSTNLDGCQKEGVTFYFASERGGYQESKGCSLKKVVVLTLEKTMVNF